MDFLSLNGGPAIDDIGVNVNRETQSQAHWGVVRKIGWCVGMAASLFLSGCAAPQGNECTVIEISTTMKIIPEYGYVHSPESVFKAGAEIFSLRAKVAYGDDGVEEKLFVYKPEGVLEYGKEEIRRDLRLLDQFRIRVSPKLRWIDGDLIDSTGESVQKTEIDGACYFRQDRGERVVFYRVAPPCLCSGRKE